MTDSNKPPTAAQLVIQRRSIPMVIGWINIFLKKWMRKSYLKDGISKMDGTKDDALYEDFCC